MRYFQCKCGNYKAHSSMGVPHCRVCPKCGSTMAESPKTHPDPEPHQFILRFEKKQNENLKIWKECTRCQTRKNATEQEEMSVFEKLLDELTTVEGTLEEE